MIMIDSLNSRSKCDKFKFEKSEANCEIQTIYSPTKERKK